MQEENTNTNVSGGGLSADTEKLLRKYLKLEIAARMWNMIFRLILICLIGFSVIFSTTTLLPLVTKQLGALGEVYGMPTSSGGGLDMGSITEMVNELTPEQKEIIVKQVKGASTSTELSNR